MRIGLFSTGDSIRLDPFTLDLLVSKFDRFFLADGKSITCPLIIPYYFFNKNMAKQNIQN